MGFLVQVFKTAVDPYLGHISYLRVLTGTVRNDSNLTNGRTGDSERFRNLVTMRGGEWGNLYWTMRARVARVIRRFAHAGRPS